MVWGCFSQFSLGPVLPAKGSVHATAQTDISDHYMLTTIWLKTLSK